jgi:alkylation response protein AidB-like acyl-CoA dehydrogenase
MENAFALSDTRRQFRHLLRNFADDRVAPNAAADRDLTYPRASFDACRELELPALGIPVEYGGAGGRHCDRYRIDHSCGVREPGCRASSVIRVHACTCASANRRPDRWEKIQVRHCSRALLTGGRRLTPVVDSWPF